VGAHENRLGWRCDRAFPFPFCFFLFSLMYMSNRVEMERDSKFVVPIMCFLIKIIFYFFINILKTFKNINLIFFK
jgi:hypothetical protein